MIKNQYKSNGNEFVHDLNIDDVDIDLNDGDYPVDPKKTNEVPIPAFDFFSTALAADDDCIIKAPEEDDEALIVFENIKN